ncbi:uncharacterized protein LOC113294180 [Papaver somniferum]|uniref:uncharacterized protein LOC113294180 n=1 Tax=Papaver somniferum TaxID=3469 RepID=UPI000E702BD9|nr:uncharacterized protein LOC113294180 [Papaver somniferum]
MGFEAIWRMWIKGCIQKIPFYVLVNGSSCGKFTSEKGLRQGDSLSPFIFLLVSEVLNIMFSKALVAGKLGGFAAKTGGTSVGHLQFADDTLVFLDADIEQVRFLKYILLSFEYVSGISTNFNKCSLFAVGEVVHLDDMASVLGCSCDSFPAIYLGLLLGEHTLSKSKWDKVIEICKARLSFWKRNSLSKAGKLTLIKSVLLSLPIYYFSFFLAPKSVVNKIEKKIRNFLWHSSADKKNVTWVGWSKVSKPLDRGGLGIRKLSIVNKSLLKKWWWRLGRERDSLWAKIILDKYDFTDLGWRSKVPSNAHGVSLWKNISKVADDFLHSNSVQDR